MFGLFKTKLSEYNHKYIVNYLISEEATAQWQYHVHENNFEKSAFRGQPFAKNTVKMFIDNYIQMKVDDNLLTLIVNLGFRKCVEWIDDYKSLEKKLVKLSHTNLLKKTCEYLYFSNFMESDPDYANLKFDHDKFVNEGMKNVDFRKRFKDYNLLMQIMRDLDCHTKNLLNHKDSKKLNRTDLDELIKSEEDVLVNSSKSKKNEIIKQIKKDSEKKFSDRNLANEIGH